ncbi:SDR family oxidoreductase [Vagococcus salmoninarum]|uniref:SDR family oxidoreductase n=1 Tax=Vagococcus salmoninarum TaxID=2739 RepID=UPI0018825029|nr:SDR family oxidoreductase [Vagococcus salmoninarum]MBE9388332.1 SDR family oxidoreductase [Vagococcus salmoninarum]
MKKKLVVITGASSGFGKEMAYLFSRKGHPLLLIGRRKELMEEFNLPNTLVEKVDVSHQESFVAAVKKAEELYGPVDLLINNAGQMLLGDLGKQEPLEWQRMIEANLLGTLNGVSAVLPQMKAAKTGTIINVSSIAGFKAFANHAAYCATKYGVHGLTETVRLEASADNVRVLLISPGAAETDLLTHTTDAEIKDGYNEWKETMGGLAMDPQEVAESVAFMYERPQNVSIRELVIASTRQDN